MQILILSKASTAGHLLYWNEYYFVLLQKVSERIKLDIFYFHN